MTTPKKTVETVLDKVTSATPESVPPQPELKSQTTGRQVRRPVAARKVKENSPLFSAVSIAIITGMALIALVSVVLVISMSSDVSRMRQDLTNLKQRVDAQMVEIGQLERDNEDLRQQKDEYAIQNDNMTLLIEDQQRNMDQMDQYIADLKERNRVLGGRNQVLTNISSRFERENALLKAQIHEYKRLIDSLVIAHIEINQSSEGIPIDVLDTLHVKTE